MSGQRAYPLPRPADDDRFSLGLALDVAQVLVQHGYPPMQGGLDLVELQQALFRFLYVQPGEAGL